MDFESMHQVERNMQFIHRKSKPVKCALILGTFLVITACILYVAINKGYLTSFSRCAKNSDCSGSSSQMLPEPQAQEQCEIMCTTAECLEAASELASFVDLAVDPCEDFYSFACGRRAEETFVANFNATVSHQALLVSRTMAKMRRTIENVNEENKQSVSFKRKKLFDSCLRYARSDEIGTSEIRSWLAAAGIADWPRLADDWSTSAADFDRLVGAFQSVAENPFLQIVARVEGQPEIFRKNRERLGRQFVPNTPNETVIIDLMPKDDCGPVNIEDYRNLSLSVLLLLGASENEANEVIDDMVEIHNMMENASTSGPEEKLDCSIPDNAINNRWCVLILQQLEYSNSEVNLSNSNIALESAAFFEFVDRLLNEYSQRKIINFLSLKFILNLMESIRLFEKSFLPDRLFPVHYECPKPPRPYLVTSEDLCVYWLTENLHFILTPDYIEQHDVVPLAEKVDDLFDRVRQTGESIVQNATALTESEQEGLGAMFRGTAFNDRTVVGYFSTVFDAETAFSQLRISEKFISNAIAVKKFRVDDALRIPENHVISMMKELSPLKTRAANGQMIDVNIGFMQPPAIGLNRPRYLDFGHLGMIIAHEFAHNFDFQLMHERMTMDALHVCLAEQYSRYEIPELKIQSDGNFTLHENFADNLGVFLAYKAYLKYLEEFGEEAFLPGPIFTNKQMFFIYFGQTLCEYGSTDGYKMYIGNSHSPAHQRIQGTLKNSKEFSEVFNCPVGSPMNPEKKCELYFS